MKLSELHLGQRVIHPQWGEGVVKAINEFAAEVLFLEGRKPIEPESLPTLSATACGRGIPGAGGVSEVTGETKIRAEV